MVRKFSIFFANIKFSNICFRVRLVRELGGEGRRGILTEGRGDILIKNVFDSQGEGRRF